MNIQEMINCASEYAEEEFEANGHLDPLWFAETAAGDHFMVPPLNNKNLTAVVVRALFKQVNAVRCVLVDEAWVVTGDKNLEKWSENHDGISTHPDRREVIIFVAEDERGSVTARRKIIRSEGSPPHLGPLEVQNDYSVMEGRFVGMLPQRGRPH